MCGFSYPVAVHAYYNRDMHYLSCLLAAVRDKPRCHGWLPGSTWHSTGRCSATYINRQSMRTLHTESTVHACSSFRILAAGDCRRIGTGTGGGSPMVPCRSARSLAIPGSSYSQHFLPPKGAAIGPRVQQNVVPVDAASKPSAVWLQPSICFWHL